MCSCFKDVMLEVVLVYEYCLRNSCRHLMQTVEIPFVQTREVVERESVPCLTNARACYALFKEWWPYISAYSLYALMVVTTAVVPKSVVLVPNSNVLRLNVRMVEGGAGQ